MEKEKGRGERKSSTATTTVIVVVLLIVIVLVIFNSLSADWKQEIDMYLTVANYTGFNVDPEALFFGAVPRGGTSRRTVTVENIYGTDLEVLVVAKGELAEWASFSKSNFVLGVGQNETVDITIAVPGNAAFGNYTGRAIILFNKR